MADSGTVSVPNVVGLTQSAAGEMLKSAGLVVGTVTTASSSTTPKGSRSGAHPAVGVPVASGSVVNLQVSSGPAQVAVPNVGGATQSSPQAAIPKVVGLTQS